MTTKTPVLRRAALGLVIAGALVAGLVSAPQVPWAGAQERVGKDDVKIQIEWGEHQSKHYKIDHEKAIPTEVVEKIAQELEDILAQYKRLFGFEPKEKLLVRFMDSQNTYEQVGGDPRMAGFFNPGSGYLVIRQMPYYDLVPTVYHEAFHQYLQAFVGKVPVPIWFNEGMASYFEGMQRNEKTRAKELDPNDIKRGKMRMVKDAVLTRTSIPLEKLLDVTHEEFHEKDNEPLYYSQSFALMYFFMEKTKKRAALKYMKELQKTKDPEAANATLFGEERKNLKKVEAMWKSYMVALDTKN